MSELSDEVLSYMIHKPDKDWSWAVVAALKELKERRASALLAADRVDAASIAELGDALSELTSNMKVTPAIETVWRVFHELERAAKTSTVGG